MTLRLIRTLMAGHPDGIYRSENDRLPVDEPSLRTAAEHDPDWLDRLVEVSRRAPVRNGALAGLAVALKCGHLDVRRRASMLTPQVCRTGRDLLKFAAGLRQLGGFGRLTRASLARWYLESPLSELVDEPEPVAGWRHRDVLRMCHVKAKEPDRRARIGGLVGSLGSSLGEPDTAFRWPAGSSKRLVAIDASSALDRGRILGVRPRVIAARWGLAATAVGDEVVSFRRDGWTDAHTEWRTGVTELSWSHRTPETTAIQDLDPERAAPADPGLVIRYAMMRGLDVSSFVIISARAPWTRPDQHRRTLAAYRRAHREASRPTPSTTVAGASLVVVGLKSGGVSLNDANDPISWGVEGFGPETPEMVAYLANERTDAILRI